MTPEPKDPQNNELNTLISFGKSLLYTTVLSEIYKTHLDPTIAYLHTTNNRRFTLNLDIAEIFKPIIVDRLIFTLINRRKIKPSDLHQITGGISMKENVKGVAMLIDLDTLSYNGGSRHQNTS